ncbi:MAG: HEPN domain-containing protein, partial [Actinomycetota bacterium]|nr:HEPN domain-containing protein [Actinomycetota bacterium]
LPPPLALRGLGTPGDDGLGFLNRLRVSAGGTLPQTDAGDPSGTSLQVLGRDLYPLLLMGVGSIRPDFMDASMSLSTGLFDHPSTAAFYEAVAEDPELAALFPNGIGSPYETVSYVWESTGRGGTVQLAMLPATILQAAFAISRMEGSRADGFTAEIPRMLDRIKAALRWEDATIPAYLGFNNITFVDGPINTPAGSVRPYGTQAEGLVPPSSLPPTRGSDPRRIGFVLQTEVPFRVSIKAAEDDSEPPEMWTVAQDKLDETRELIELSWSLGVRRDPPVSCALGWSLVADPLSPGPAVRQGPTTRPATEPFVGEDENLKEVVEWIELLARRPRRELDIAKRRILSALTGRIDDTDAFVDAVISWENMVGAGSEIRFRVSTLMAWLIRDDEAGRLELQRKIAKFYAVRSQVVHGGRHLEPKEARDLRREAVALSVPCLRRLLVEFPDLAEDKDRSIKLLARLSSYGGDAPQADTAMTDDGPRPS